MLPFKRPLLLDEKSAFVQGGGHLIFGVDQDEYGGSFLPTSTLCGDLIDTRLYNSLLSIEEMLSFGNCKPMTVSHPPIVDFSDIQLFKQGKAVTISKMSREVVCRRQAKPFRLVFPEMRNYQSSVLLCHASGGKLTLPKNHLQNLEIVQTIQGFSSKCDDRGDHISHWIGVKANLSSNTWEDYLTGQPAPFVNFAKEFDYMVKELPCAALSNNDNNSSYWFARWFPTSCGKAQYCTMCDYQDIVMFSLRGLCESTLYDREYALAGPQTGKPSFLGVSTSRIIWKPSDGESVTDGHWILIDDEATNLLGEMEMAINEYPIGRKQWQIHHDKCGTSELELMLTRCREDQFTCDDGTCIPLDNRCDLTIHCDDSSDEHNCKVCSHYSFP